MADNISVRDATGAVITLSTEDISNVHHPRHVVTDASGNPGPAMDTAARAGYVIVTNGTQNLPTMDAVGRRGYVTVTDGTNSFPTADAVGRALFAKVTDGTNTLPTLDAVGRAGFVKLTDGTDTCGIDDVDGALDETANTWVQTASCLFALDAAASAQAQAVPLQVESTAAPNLRVGVFNGADEMPAGASATTPVFVTPATNAANGATLHNTRGLVGTATAVKATAGTLYSVLVTNNHSSACFLQIFNIAHGSVTPGTSVPVIEVYVPATSTLSLAMPAVGVPFSTAISMIATTARGGGTGTTAATCDVSITYK